MPRPLPFLLALATGLAVGVACYSERQPPPTFRYSCNADADCDAPERCMHGLCQVPCSMATASEVCTGDNHLACFNGACSTGCNPADDDACPKAQTCVDIGLMVSQGGFFGSSEDQSLGVCGTACTEGSCPAGEICLEGFCLQPCDDGDECGTGFSCVMGFCILGGGTSGGDEASATDDGTESTEADGTGDSTASTGGGT